MYFNQLENLDERIAVLLRDSQDPNFTEYLGRLQGRVAAQKQQVVALVEELNRNEQIYRNNMQLRNRQVQPQMQQQMQPQPQPPVVEVRPVEVVQSVEVTLPSEVAQPVEVTQPMEVAQSVETSQPVTISQPVAVPRPAAQPRPKNTAEFAIGATVLSIVGSVFILAALVMLGMYFMTGLTKGMLMYGGCLLVMLLAELLVYRKFPRLGMTLSAVGMGGLYISTLVNYLVLKNFNQWVAIGITLFITLVVILLGRKRDAASYRILGMSAMYVCILMVVDGKTSGGVIGQVEFVTLSVIAFIVNIMCLCVPVKKSHTAIQITHMILNTLFTFIAYFKWAGFDGHFDSVGEMWQYPLFVALSVVIMQLIFVIQIRWQDKQVAQANMGHNAGICVAYGMSSLLYILLVAGTTDFIGLVVGEEGVAHPFLIPRLVCSIVSIVICVLPMLALRHKQEKWFIWYLLNLLVLVIHGGSNTDMEFYLCLLVLLAASKLLSFTKRPMLRISDAVITTYACICTLADWKDPYVIVVFAGLVLGVPCINYWKTYFELILTFTIAFFATWHMLPMLELPVFVGVMFVGMLLYNNVERWRGEGIIVYNIFALIGQAVCYLLLINPVYRNSYLTYLCMLIFGVTTIVVCLQKKYQLEFKSKPLIMAMFLTYMGLVLRTGYPIVNSILLMIIALGCVGAGFVIQKKSVRIYGLMLSLAVCVKLVVYDFMGVNNLQKTILFFAVGVLALIIAGIYMVLERNNEKQQRQEISEI